MYTLNYNLAINVFFAFLPSMMSYPFIKGLCIAFLDPFTIILLTSICSRLDGRTKRCSLIKLNRHLAYVNEKLSDVVILY